MGSVYSLEGKLRLLLVSISIIYIKDWPLLIWINRNVVTTLIAARFNTLEFGDPLKTIGGNSAGQSFVSPPIVVGYQRWCIVSVNPALSIIVSKLHLNASVSL